MITASELRQIGARASLLRTQLEGTRGRCMAEIAGLIRARHLFSLVEDELAGLALGAPLVREQANASSR